MTAITLSDLVDEYLAAKHTGGYAGATIRSAGYTTRAFLAHVGNIQVRHVQARHVDSYFAARLSKGLQPSSMNVELHHLRMLFRHAFVRRHLVGTADPTAHRRPMRTAAKAKRRIPASEFGRLLDACTHPRDRMVVALGIYLLLRQSEITALTIADVDLTHGSAGVRQVKTGKFDEMPLSAELERELRRWLTWYAEHAGPLQPEWLLVPSKTRPPFRGNEDGTGVTPAPEDSKLQPTRPVVNPEKIIHRAMHACGYTLRDERGQSTRDGVHTLRRSAARAIFDRLVDDGYDGAGRIVQALLHHSSFQQTEAYLGIEQDKKRRDDMIRGKEMFPIVRDNVVGIEVARGNA